MTAIALFTTYSINRGDRSDLHAMVAMHEINLCSASFFEFKIHLRMLVLSCIKDTIPYRVWSNHALTLPPIHHLFQQPIGVIGRVFMSY